MPKRNAPEFCPECGAAVPEGARACPACGSDAETGWSDAAQENRLGIPSEKFDYDEFVKEEFAGETNRRLSPKGIALFLWIVAILLLLLLLNRWWPRAN